MTRYQRIRVILSFREINPTERCVLIALCERADKYMSVAPSQQSIATPLGISLRAVRDAMKSLDERGYIERTTQRRAATGYRFVDKVKLACMKSSFAEPKRADYRRSLAADFAGSPAADFAAPLIYSKGESKNPAGDANVVFFPARGASK